jgi:pimeloyl-ACP methyl ester carboxylesterase
MDETGVRRPAMDETGAELIVSRTAPSGEVPTTCEEMGANAVAFIKALGLTQVDVLGISIGGFVAQEITLQAPELVRNRRP